MNDYTREKIKMKEHKRNGEDKNFRGKKIGSRILSESFKRLGNLSKALNVYTCLNALLYKADKNNLDEIKKKNDVKTCKCKLCPLCASRRSNILFNQSDEMINYMDEHYGFRYIFATFTIENVKEYGVKEAFERMRKGFKTMRERVAFERVAVGGWMRSWEVTHRFKENDYHPHMHVLIAVDEKYFTEYENYMNHQEWMELWKDCMKLDYDPWVHVRKVERDKEKTSKGKITYRNAIAEITKYTTKIFDVLVTWSNREYFEKKAKMKLRDKQHAEELTDRVVSTLDRELDGIRMVGFGGIMKEVRKLLKMKSPEDEIKEEEASEAETAGNEENTEETEEILVVTRFDNTERDYVLDEERTSPIFVEHIRKKIAAGRVAFTNGGRYEFYIEDG